MDYKEFHLNLNFRGITLDSSELKAIDPEEDDCEIDFERVEPGFQLSGCEIIDDLNGKKIRTVRHRRKTSIKTNVYSSRSLNKRKSKRN